MPLCRTSQTGNRGCQAADKVGAAGGDAAIVHADDAAYDDHR